MPRKVQLLLQSTIIKSLIAENPTVQNPDKIIIHPSTANISLLGKSKGKNFIVCADSWQLPSKISLAYALANFDNISQIKVLSSVKSGVKTALKKSLQSYPKANSRVKLDFN